MKHRFVQEYYIINFVRLLLQYYSSFCFYYSSRIISLLQQKNHQRHFYNIKSSTVHYTCSAFILLLTFSLRQLKQELYLKIARISKARGIQCQIFTLLQRYIFVLYPQFPYFPITQQITSLYIFFLLLYANFMSPTVLSCLVFSSLQWIISFWTYVMLLILHVLSRMSNFTLSSKEKHSK